MVLTLGFWFNTRTLDIVFSATGRIVQPYIQEILEPLIQDVEDSDSLPASRFAFIEGSGRDGEATRTFAAMKIWSRQGKLVFSTAPGELGTIRDMGELAPVLDGKTVSHPDDSGDEIEPVGSGSEQLFEIYVPLRDLKTGRVIAVAELYNSADDVGEALGRSIMENWYVFGTSVSLVFAILLAVAWRGSATIERQRDELTARVSELQDLSQKNMNLQVAADEAARHVARLDELRLNRIGAELHDGVAQQLTFIALMIDQIEARVPDASGPQLGDKFIRLRKATDEAIKEIRWITEGLSAAGVDDNAELTKVIEHIVHKTEAQSGLPIYYEADSDLEQIRPEVARDLARIAQEALTNAVRHAGGKGMAVRLKRDGASIVLAISDTGPGLQDNSEASKSGRASLGLPSMQFRAASLGGTLTVQQNSPHGTLIICRIPFDRGQQE